MREIVNTSDEAELLNCIENVQACMTDIGKIITQMPGNATQKQQLTELCQKTALC